MHLSLCQMVKNYINRNIWIWESVSTRARLISFLGRYRCFSLLILIFLYDSSSICFASWGKMNTPAAILPSAKCFQTTVKKYYSAYFFLQATKTMNIITQVTIILWGKICTPRSIFPPAEHDWLDWSHDKFGQHDCLSWLWRLQMGQFGR